MSEDKEDRQYEPSEQKLRRAREKGDIPRSAEANTAMSYLAMTAGLLLLAPGIVAGWVPMAARLLGDEPWPAAGPGAAGGVVLRAVLGILGIACLPGLAVLLGQAAQRSLTFTPSRIAPDPKKINPLHNFGQKFGGKALTGFALSLAKVGAVGAGGWLLLKRLSGWVLQSAQTGDRAWITALPMLMRQVLLLALAIAIVFAAIDIAWKWFDFRKRNMMTRKEMEDEHKESEGNPHFKAARRQRAVDLALGSMLADVERADVIIVNPTHYAVALEWKRGSGRAPVCLAKGVDEIAARIRERARTHKVPIWSDPPCARALYAQVKIGDEITRDQFGPVAAAIRFAEAMRIKARQGWGGAMEGGKP